MASALKAKLSSAASALTSPTSSSTDKADTNSQGNDRRADYRLRITAGPDYDKSLQQQVTVNSEAAHQISPECAISIRIRDYTGLPSTSPPTSSAYFSLPQHSKDTFSIAWALTPIKNDIPATNLVFGLDTGHNPLRKYGLPKSLVHSAFRIVKEFIDPSLSCDIGADEPWIRGPVVAGASTTLNIGDAEGEMAIPPSPHPRPPPPPSLFFPHPSLLVEGATSSAAASYREQQAGLPRDAATRRKRLLSTAARERFVLQRGRTYYFDFSNGYIDWAGYALKLPGFSVPVLKWIGGGGGGGGSKRRDSAAKSGRGSAPGSPRSSMETPSGRMSGESSGSDDIGSLNCVVEGTADPRHAHEREHGHEHEREHGREQRVTESSHKVRFFLKDIVSGDIYFVIMCTLLTGEDLRLALEEDGRREIEQQASISV